MSARLTQNAGLALLCAALLPLPATAQPRAGLHGGLSRSALVMDSGDSEFRAGLVGGGWLRLPLSSAVGVQIGAYYADKGASYSLDDVTATIELTYFEFPLLFVISPARGGSVGPYVAFGGALAVERGCRIAARAGGSSASVDCDATGGQDLPLFYPEKLDVAFALGAGLEIEQGPVLLTLDLRAHFGLREAFLVSPPDPSLEADRGQNLHLGVLAGIAFPLGPSPGR